MGGNGWEWLKMGENGWEWVGMGGNGWPQCLIIALYVDGKKGNIQIPRRAN